jgi:putative nucleotidyltransferase with HDIG domain
LTMDKTDILKKLDQVENLPTLPLIVQQIQKLIGNPNSNMAQIALVITRDQSIAARVVRLVNSAFYGLGNKISSIQQAIMLLGLNTVKNLVIGVSVVKTFEGARNATLFDREKFWLHSFACATGARLIAKKLGRDEPEDFFMAGLLHDIGILVLDQFFHEEFVTIVQRSLLTKTELTEVEKSVLGASHCEIGAFMAVKWRIPEYLALAIRHHHKPVFSEIETETFRLITAAVHVADTNACNRGNNPGFPCTFTLHDPALQLTGLKNNEIDDIFIQVETDIKQVMSDWGIRVSI